MGDGHLDKLRNKLDETDSKIVSVIAERFDIIEEIGLYKKENNIPMMQPHRIQHVKAKASKLAMDYKLRPEFIKTLFSLIIDEACERQVDIIAGAE